MKNNYYYTLIIFLSFNLLFNSSCISKGNKVITQEVIDDCDNQPPLEILESLGNRILGYNWGSIISGNNHIASGVLKEDTLDLLVDELFGQLSSLSTNYKEKRFEKDANIIFRNSKFCKISFVKDENIIKQWNWEGNITDEYQIIGKCELIKTYKNEAVLTRDLSNSIRSESTSNNCSINFGSTKISDAIISKYEYYSREKKIFLLVEHIGALKIQNANSN